MEIENRTLNTRQASEYLGVSCSWLRQARMGGKRLDRLSSPPYFKLGRRVVYLKSDLDHWLTKHRVESLL